jgi:hypothetical protein
MPDVRARELQQAGHRGVTVAARFGYLTHGLVYGMMGVLALQVALGLGGRITDSQGAVRRLGEQGPGNVLLWAIATGLACYSAWGVVRALLDPEHAGRDGKGAVKRIGYAVSAISHGLLALYTFQLASGTATGGKQGLPIGEVLGMPGGQLALGIAGLSVVGFGSYQLYKAIKNEVGREFAGSDLSPSRRSWVMGMSRLGHGARGVVFLIVGGSLVVAAFRARASEARDFSDALRELALQPFGNVLLGIVALGLLAYGVHMLFVARYARIPHTV